MKSAIILLQPQIAIVKLHQFKKTILRDCKPPPRDPDCRPDHLQKLMRYYLPCDTPLVLHIDIQTVKQTNPTKNISKFGGGN